MTSSAPRLTGGDLLARTLHAAGVRKVFALHGGHLEALFKGCVEQGIDLVDFRHEASAGHAADGYARVTGKLGVCVITAGPGYANAMAAIANAQLDGAPVLFIIGAAPLREVETNPMQGGIDQIAMARPAVKWAMSVPDTARIPDLTAMAIRKAMSGRKGPVVLELPIDILHMSVPADRATTPSGLDVAPRPGPSQEELKALLALIVGAKRPAIIAGFDAISARAAKALQAFAEKTNIPVFAKTQALGLVPSDHPLDGGAAGNLAVLPLMGKERPDLVLLIGGRMGLLLGGRSGGVVPHEAKLVQVHSDAGEIGRIRDVDLAIAADCSELLEVATAALGGVKLPDFSAWAKTAVSAKAAFGAAFQEKQTAGGVHPYHAALAVAAAAGPEAIYVLDGGEAASWAGACLKVNGPQQILGHGYLGCLGTGPGFSVGAQVAHPGRRVVQVTGDGAMGFHIQEFDTMVRHGLPIVTVVFNNQVWGMSIHGQQIMYGGNYNVITKISGTHYANIAAAFGCHAERVAQHEDIGPAMQRALDCGRPALVEIMTDADVVHPVTISMLGQIPDGTGDVLIPYYENVPAGA